MSEQKRTVHGVVFTSYGGDWTGEHVSEDGVELAITISITRKEMLVRNRCKLCGNTYQDSENFNDFRQAALVGMQTMHTCPYRTVPTSETEPNPKTSMP
jgi:hypothetical protein